MTKPIRPGDVGAEKGKHIPAAVFDAFNTEIAKHFSSGSAIVKQETVLMRLVEGGMQRREIFDAGWLNIEEAYKDVGWKVTYDKPGFNETGESFFKFEPR